MSKIVLPPKYYLTHFFEFLDFIEEHYQHILEESQIQFIADFRAMSEDAQCAYIRMVNRKGSVFDKASFVKYSEIEDTTSALKELATEGFTAALDDAHKSTLLDFLTKGKLHKWLTGNGHKVASSLSREMMKDYAREHLDSLDLGILPAADDLILHSRTDDMEYLLFLYFGKIQKSLSLYTLRDLGIRQTQNLKGKFKARYKSKEEARAEFFFAKQLDLSFDLLTEKDFQQILDQAKTFQRLPGSTQGLKDELLFTMAEYLLGSDDELAMAALAESRHIQAREKLARHLYKLDRKEECLILLEQMQTEPRADQELLFAEDFLARKYIKKKVGMLYEVLKNARTVVLSDFYLKRPESGVCELYKSQGHTAYFTENSLWTSLFGILFWQELFESEDAAIYNPFDRSPGDLVGPDFYLKNQQAIEAKLSLLKNEKAISKLVLKNITEHYGKLNDVFQWRTYLANTLINFVGKTQNQDVAKVLRTVAQKYDTHHSGFPDLMIEKDSVIQFIEVKAEGDSLRASQLSRIRLLKEAGFEVEVLKVKWEADPNQVYVVVDVETTGGSSNFHRVTEIGAVKVQNGKVIDEFQTLLNPGRLIPAFITNITGISNEMVADAPRFEEIADKFYEFLEGSIFVAHNVKFDYGFIQKEFSRAGIEFVRAQMCTCNGMRKTHPGIKSYSLKNLTDHFRIEMEQHHRALSDARAAAELLLIMNGKRCESFGDEYSQSHPD